MSNDKLRDLTPAEVTFNPGERPSDEKLEGMMLQVQTGLEYLENSIGDMFGESLQKENIWASNIARDIGDRSLLNPILMPNIFIDNYVQELIAGETEHELDLIPVGTGANIILSSSDTSVVQSQFKNTVKELTVPGDWTIESGITEGGIFKNSRKLTTHAPSDGGTIIFAQVTSGRGSAYVEASHNTIPSIAQALDDGPFVSVVLNDAEQNIYTITLPIETLCTNSSYDSVTPSLSNTKSGVGSGQQLKLPNYLFNTSGLDLETNDPLSGLGKLFPNNIIRIYDWAEKKVVSGLLEVKASSVQANRRFEIIVKFSPDIVLDVVSGKYLVVTSGTSLAGMVGALQRDFYFHKHSADDMVRGVEHSKLYGLRTNSPTGDRSEYYGPSSIDHNDHSQYFHRDGFTDSDTGAGGNVIRGHVVVGSTTLGSEPAHEHYNLTTDSYDVYFGDTTSKAPSLKFKKVVTQNLTEGRGNIPANFSDTALHLTGAVDDTSQLLRTTFVSGNFRVDGNTVLGSNASHDVIIPGDIYVYNSLLIKPKVSSTLVGEEGKINYDSVEKTLMYYNGTTWVNPSPYAVTVGDGVNSFGKYNSSNHTGIASAVAQLAGTGGSIKVLRGTYNFGANTINLTSGIHLTCDGSKTIFTGSGTGFNIASTESAILLNSFATTGFSTAINIDGTGVGLDNISLSSGTNGITLGANAQRVNISSTVSFDNISNKILNSATVTNNLISKTKSIGYQNDFLVIDHANKPAFLDSWKKISGAGTLSYVDTSDSKIGRGVWAITGNGTWALEDFMPVIVEVGVGGYILFKSLSGAAQITAGCYSYDSALSLLPNNGGFIADVVSTTLSWEYKQSMCSTAGVLPQQFHADTKFIRPVITVANNTGTVYFDGFNIFPMSFSRMSRYADPNYAIIDMGAGLDIDWNLHGPFSKEISSNTTFTFSNISEGQSILLRVKNTSGAKVTANFATPCLWSYLKVQDVPAGKTNIYSFTKIAGDIHAAATDAMVLIS